MKERWSKSILHIDMFPLVNSNAIQTLKSGMYADDETGRRLIRFYIHGKYEKRDLLFKIYCRVIGSMPHHIFNSLKSSLALSKELWIGLYCNKLTQINPHWKTGFMILITKILNSQKN